MSQSLVDPFRKSGTRYGWTPTHKCAGYRLEITTGYTLHQITANPTKRYCLVCFKTSPPPSSSSSLLLSLLSSQSSSSSLTYLILIYSLKYLYFNEIFTHIFVYLIAVLSFFLSFLNFIALILFHHYLFT